MALPILQKERTLNELQAFTKSITLKEEEALIIFLTETLDPKFTKSRADVEEPARANDLKLKLLPKVKQSQIDSAQPEMPLIDNCDPSLIKLLKESVEENVTISNTLRESPNLAYDLKDTLDVKCR
jgi:hypothetical protein